MGGGESGANRGGGHKFQCKQIEGARDGPIYKTTKWSTQGANFTDILSARDFVICAGGGGGGGRGGRGEGGRGEGMGGGGEGGGCSWAVPRGRNPRRGCGL